MCGFLAYMLAHPEMVNNEEFKRELIRSLMEIRYRGPDDTKALMVSDKLFYGFHRLAINGLGHESDEPLDVDDVVLICNGEIYNYPSLVQEHRFKMKTKNDCETIIHLYRKFGLEQALHKLDGVFSFVLYDRKNGMIYVANDPLGIRPLFQGTKKTIIDSSSSISGEKTVLSYCFASEPIALVGLADTVSFFPPGHYMRIFSLPEDVDDPKEIHLHDKINLTKLHQSSKDTSSDKTNGSKIYTELIQYFNPVWNAIDSKMEPAQIIPIYRKLLEQAVEKRLLGERPIASLLSGGLDSSTVASIASKFLKAKGIPLHTYSIGLKDAPDLHYADIMAKHIGSIHHEIIVEESDFLQIIPKVIRAIQSFDTTTVRASCGNFLLGKYISETSDFKIIFNGDLSEEINASYFYSYFAPSDYEFFKDNVRLIKEVHKYDVIRSARCMEHFGLEPRTPFEDKELVDFVMSIHPKWKRFHKDQKKAVFPMEKMLMRQAVADLLPPEVLWRPKVAFSDGVSKKERSWHKIIEEYVNGFVSDEEFKENQNKWGKPIPLTKEAYWYRKIYHELLGDGGDKSAIIGEYWMPRFVDGIKDPSARELIKLAEAQK